MAFVLRWSRLPVWRLLLVLAVGLGSFAPEPSPVQAEVDIAAVPVSLVAGGVSSFGADGPLVYWVTQPQSCPAGTPPETTIKRTRSSGWEERTVFRKTPVPGEPCPYRIYSNVVADASYIYWIDQWGVVRFPVAGSPTGEPERILNIIYTGGSQELAISDVYLWGYTGGHLWGLEKANPSSNFAIGYTGPENSTNLQWDGKYLYMIRGTDRQLQRYTPQGGVRNIDTGVTTYAPVGTETSCFQLICTSTEYVYYVKLGSENVVRRYDNVANAYAAPYTSIPPAGMSSRIYAITTGVTSAVNILLTRDVFFFEKQWVPCACFETNSTDFLRRLDLGLGPADTLHVRASTTSWTAANFLPTDRFLFWKEVTSVTPNNYGNILRMAMNAEALPSINMRVTGFHITQGVQTPDNAIFLIRNRPTYFRLFVRSDGANVSGVTARLTAHWSGEPRDSIAPVTPLMTVRSNYSDIYLTNGFLFELPREWLLHDDLMLEPVLNPGGVPLEPNYNDNRFANLIGPFTINPNPQARFHVVRMSYNWGGTNFTANDFDAIVSWLYRAYPIGLEPGQAVAGDQVLTNNDLAARMRDFNNLRECQYLNNTRSGVDNRNLCASYFLHDQLAALRRDGVLPRRAYIYASVVGLPRGSASPNNPVSNGPDLVTNGFAFEMAGFYAGHEIGHLLGRGHPNEMGDDPATARVEGCGHSRVDPNYPYFFTWIGDPDNQVVGFDSRFGVAGGSRRVMTYYDVRDVMGYCNTPDQWLSDYTYLGIYNFLRNNPGPPAPNLAQGASAALAGDWLDLSGRFTPGGPAAFTYARRTSSVVEMPGLTPGGYTLRLVDAGGAVLSQHSITPAAVEDSVGWWSFEAVIPFVSGAAQAQLVDDADSTVLAVLSISASAPQVSQVSVPGATPPLQGLVPLTWTASDADSPNLTYDLFFSVDGGETFSPLELGLTGSSAEVNTDLVPGSMSVVFRVVASDGVNTGYADSPPYQVAVKPPDVRILSPSEGQRVQYGTPLQLTGYALDLQDGSITADSSLVWSGPEGVLGEGQVLTLTDLPTGSNTITLTAYASTGYSNSASVTVIVGDDLYEPPSVLTAAPNAVNLQTPGEAPAPQSAPVYISNGVGNTELNWTASSDVPWLQLDAASGRTPSTVTLTADPDGLPPNSTQTGTVTVVSGGQSVVVTVTLQIGPGAVWAPPPAAEMRTLYLPLAFNR